LVGGQIYFTFKDKTLKKGAKIRCG